MEDVLGDALQELPEEVRREFFEEGIHDDPDEFPQDLRCLQHPCIPGCWSSWQSVSAAIITDPQFCS